MPHLVNIRERDGLLTDAVLRLVGRGGVEAVTVSGVAAEAGVGISAVRHSRATREELLTRTVATFASRREIARREAGLRLWRRSRSRNGVESLSSVSDYLVEAELPTTPESLALTAAWLLLCSGPGLSPRARRCFEADGAEQLAVCDLVVRSRAAVNCASENCASETRASETRASENRVPDEGAGVLLRSVVRGLLLGLGESGFSGSGETERLLRRAVDALVPKVLVPPVLAPQVNDR